MSEPRSITLEEARDIFLDSIRGIVSYWYRVGGGTENIASGIAFSILVLIDGESPDFPAIDLVLRPHPDDEEYLRDQGENWYQDGMVLNSDVMLHEHFHDKEWMKE